MAKVKSIPAVRLLPLIEKFEREQGEAMWDTSLPRRFHRLRNDPVYAHVTLGVADRLLCDMDMPHAWHGELADLYEPVTA